jgi:hypothetical protein
MDEFMKMLLIGVMFLWFVGWYVFIRTILKVINKP